MYTDFRELIRFLATYTRGAQRARLSIVIVSVAGGISGLCTTALLALVSDALNRPDGFATWAVAAFVGLCVALPVFRFLSTYVLTHLTQRGMYAFRMQMSRRILAAPLRHLESIGAPRLLAALTTDIPRVTQALTTLPTVCMHVAIVTGSLGYMAWLSWELFLIVLVVIIAGVLTYQLPVLKAMEYLRRSREEQDDLYQHFEALTNGTKELKLNRNRRDAFFGRYLEPTADQLRRDATTGHVIYGIAASWGQVLFFVLLGVLLFGVRGWMQIPTDVMMGYSLVILYLMTPLEVLLNTLPGISQAAVSVQKLESLGISLAEEQERLDGSDLPDMEAPLTLDGVTYAYEAVDDTVDGFTVGPIDLEVDSGELLFIIGGNGSGKTTLAKLLLGLYVPEEGTVALNGAEINDQNREQYRQCFSAVFPDFYLFDDLAGIGPDEGLDEKARTYLQKLRIDHKIEIEDGELSTTDLSQGQRKRLALLSAYLEDRPIYLFDEWAADQDPMFKRLFYEELLPELKARGKSVIVISHDDAYYDVADRIVKLKEGQCLAAEKGDAGLDEVYGDGARVGKAQSS